MTSKGVTRLFGNIGSVLPLLLIFFTAAGSAYACPEHRSKAAYRTKAINTRTVSHMAPVVINYGGRCADNINGARRVKHVSMMGDGYFEGGARYVAVRNRAPRTRYVAVRDIDYVEPAPRYVVVRNVAPRTRQVVVRDIDIDDAPRYVAVRRQPVYVEPEPRYVAVRNLAPRARYIAASDLDYDDIDPVPQAVSVNNIDTDLDVEIPTRRHVVVRTDDLAGTEEVIYSSPGDEIADIAPPIENIATTDAALAPVAYTGGTSIYDDLDVDDQAVLSDSGVTYVAAGDMEETCLPDAVIDTSPELVTIRAVSDASIDDIVKDAHSRGTDVTHVYDDDGHSIRYRPFVNDGNIVATETAYVMADDVDTDMVSYVPISDVDDVDATEISYLPVEMVSDVPVIDSDVSTVTYTSNDSIVTFDATELDDDMISYVPISDVDDVAATDITYLPVESVSDVPIIDGDVRKVTYVTNDSVVTLDATELDDSEVCACPTTVSMLDGEPVQFTDSSAILADDGDDFAVASMNNGDAVMATTGFEDMLSETDNDALDDADLEVDSDEIETVVE
ncbi:MAG TPA: hypothetical protein VJ781_11875 [Pyrinomonadaceae bacterium]|nr:hypothetical protein [Pyrinomonadaceae bacterium]